MPLKIFSEISKLAQSFKDHPEALTSDVIDDLGSKTQASKIDIIEKVNHIFHAGEAGGGLVTLGNQFSPKIW